MSEAPLYLEMVLVEGGEPRSFPERRQVGPLSDVCGPSLRIRSVSSVQDELVTLITFSTIASHMMETMKVNLTDVINFS